MRRLAAITSFVVFAVLTSAFAQRGGVHASGGGSHGVGGRPSGAHASLGMRGGPALSASRSFSGVHGNGFGGTRFRSRGFRHCLGCRRGFGYPWYAAYGYAGYYDPNWWWNSSSYDYDEDEAREVEAANQMNAANLEEQRWREREDRDRERIAERSVQLAPEGDARSSSGFSSPTTALVFRDEHVEEVRNYAIAGSTLWILNERAAKKIPLAQLDLPATVKVNDERGVDFQVPK